MTIFLLRNLGDAGHGETRAMVVSALNQDFARQMAATQPHSHNNEPSNGYGDEGSHVWQNDTMSSCEEVGISNSPTVMQILLTDFVYD